jgi:hypothetical protein
MASRRGPEQLLGQAPMSSTVDHGDQFTMDRACAVHHPMDRVHMIFYSKINPQPKMLATLQITPCLSTESSRSLQKFQEDPWFLKINSSLVLATFQKLQKGPYNFFSPYLRNRNSDFGDSFGKILKITSSFIL